MNFPRIRTKRHFDLFAIGLAALGLILLRGADACEAGAEPRGASGTATIPVARVGSETLYLSHLEASMATQLQQLDLQRQELLVSGLDQLIETTLLNKEAERRDLTVQELLEAEVSTKISQITQAEIDTWYKENRARIGRSQESVEEQIRAHLEGQASQRLRKGLLSTLRSQQTVEILLAPPRVAIDSVGDGEKSPTKGPLEAPVTIIEFSDFQCPWCSRIAPTLEEVAAAYGEEVRIEFRHFPLDQLHADARKASEAAYCAQEQGKFWQLHDDHFAHQKALGLDQIKGRAEGLGLDIAALEACLDSGRGATAVAADEEAGHRAGVSSTPSLFINGRPVRLVGGTPPLDQLTAVIDDELSRKDKT